VKCPLRLRESVAVISRSPLAVLIPSMKAVFAGLQNPVWFLGKRLLFYVSVITSARENR
jgi:hypothetical protein